VIVDAIVPDFQADGNNGNIGREGSDLQPVDIHDNVTDKPIIEKPEVKFIVGKRVHGIDPNVRYFNETEENNLNDIFNNRLVSFWHNVFMCFTMTTRYNMSSLIVNNMAMMINVFIFRSRPIED
jgi:hypothetical protein